MNRFLGLCFARIEDFAALINNLPGNTEIRARTKKRDRSGDYVHSDTAA